MIDYSDRPEDNQKALEVEGKYANRFFIHVGDGTVRIAFGEYTTPGSVCQMRCAAVMPLAMAQDIALALTNVLTKIAEINRAAEKEAVHRALQEKSRSAPWPFRESTDGPRPDPMRSPEGGLLRWPTISEVDEVERIIRENEAKAGRSGEADSPAPAAKKEDMN